VRKGVVTKTVEEKNERGGALRGEEGSGTR
jgi:hypothetical protein